jgi:hypothetical protein
MPSTASSACRTARPSTRSAGWHADGVLGGGSAGVALVAAFTLARELTEDDTIVAILPDSGHFYLSTYFSDAWLQANGFAADPAGNTLGTAAAHAILRDVLSVGWAQLEQRDTAWSIALVLEDGLAIGVISRDPLQPVVSEPGDAQGSGEARDRSKKSNSLSRTVPCFTC